MPTKLGYFIKHSDYYEYVSPKKSPYICKCKRSKRNYPSLQYLNYFSIKLCEYANGILRYNRCFGYVKISVQGSGKRKFKKVPCRPLRCNNVRLQNFLFPNF